MRSRWPRRGWRRRGWTRRATDAEIIAAHVHNVKRGELHTVPDSRVRRPLLGGYRPPGEPRAAAAHHRPGVLPLPGARRRPRRLRAAAGDRGDDRLGDRPAARDGRAEPVAVDLGTGSGAIALSIAQEVPRASVHAVEGDPLARSWAERNITRYVDGYTAGRVLLHAGDFVTPDPRTASASSRHWPAPSTWWSPTPRTSRSARSCRPRWGSTTRPPRCGAAATASTPSARSSGWRAWLLRPGGLVAVSTARRRARRSSGCSPRNPAGGIPPTTRTWPAGTALSRHSWPGRPTHLGWDR